MNASPFRLQGALAGPSIFRHGPLRLVAAPTRRTAIPGGRYVCQAAHKSNDGGKDVPTARSMTAEVVSVQTEQRI